MTNQRKIFGAILTLAVSAFGVDHWWLGAEPGSSRGTTPQATAPPPSHNAPAKKGRSEALDATDPAGKSTVMRSLAGRLLEVARAEQLVPDAPDGTAFVPDAFKPSSLWYPAPAPAADVVRAAPSVSPERLNEFRARHRLTAVMKSARRDGAGTPGGVSGLAIIGGKVYLPGQAVDGFILRSIGERSAVLSYGEALVELKIDPPGALSSLSEGQ